MEPHSYPFFLLAGAKNVLNVNRLAEALLIAVFTAGATTWGTTKVLEVKLSVMEENQRAMQAKLTVVSETQASAIAERKEQVKALQERMTALEKNGGARR